MTGLLRLELRRNVMPLLLPALVILLVLSPIARNLTPVALWPDRSTDLQSTIQVFGPFACGAAAWMASRERRRDVQDLVASTPYDPWRRTMVTWLATTGWALACYLAVGVVFFVVTAYEVTWGSPVWWPPVVGLLALVMCSAMGFALGARLPGRFVTPLAAVGLFAVMAAGAEASVAGRTIGLLGPLTPSIGLSSSVFYEHRPDLSEVRILCYVGVLAIALAVIVRVAVRLLVIGIVATVTAAVLISTATVDQLGVSVPVLHDPATDRAVPYTPVCRGAAIPVCLHPAYAADNELSTLTTVINTIAAPLAGGSGLPTRAVQLPGGENGGAGFRIEGQPPVLTIPHFIVHGTTLEPTQFAAEVETEVALALVTPPGTARGHATPVQRAVATYLLDHAHYSAYSPWLPTDSAVSSAAQRLSRLGPSWLSTHLDQIRNGTIEDIP
jgi:hypothetical protein